MYTQTLYSTVLRWFPNNIELQVQKEILSSVYKSEHQGQICISCNQYAINTWHKYRATRKEVFYLTTHSTHFILRLYGVGHMVNDHSVSEIGNPLLPHGLFFLINSKWSFICTIPQTGLHIPWPLLHQSWGTGWNDCRTEENVLLMMHSTHFIMVIWCRIYNKGPFR